MYVLFGCWTNVSGQKEISKKKKSLQLCRSFYARRYGQSVTVPCARTASGARCQKINDLKYGLGTRRSPATSTGMVITRPYRMPVPRPGAETVLVRTRKSRASVKEHWYGRDMTVPRARTKTSTTTPTIFRKRTGFHRV